MNPTNEHSTAERRPFRSLVYWREILAQIAIPVLFFAVVAAFVPLLQVFEADPDEGLELMKSLLVARGYPLYQEVWSNQTPLFTLALGGIFRLFGESVLAGRLLVLACSALLLWAAFQTLRTTHGMVHALAGTALILLLPYYLRLSVATMTGLPAVSLAVLALLFLVYWQQGRRSYWLILSATAFALSVLTKAFTAFLLPLLFGGILLVGWMRGAAPFFSRAPWPPALLWLAVFAALTTGLALLLIGPDHFAWLGAMHDAARNFSYFDQYDLERYLPDTRWPLLLALFAIPLAVESRRPAAFYLIVWLASAWLVLSLHRPVWFHQTLLLTVPAALLGGIGIGEAVRILREALPSRRLVSCTTSLGVLTLLITVVTLWVRTPVLLGTFAQDPDGAQDDARRMELVEIMRDHARETRWIYTDRPIYAFRAGLPIPPQLASISDMQLRTKTLTETRILEILRALAPEQILLARFDLRSIGDWAEDNYRLVEQNDGDKLFIRDDLPLPGQKSAPAGR